MFAEDELLPISAIQHLAFCPRRCALIHLERQWEENLLTAEGSLLHDRVHDLGRDTRGEVITVRALPLRSLRLGVVGQADAVEFLRCEGSEWDGGVSLGTYAGWWKPFPVEYKRGLPRSDDSHRVQLCCQALCIEEMLGVEVSEGAIFHGASRRRENVPFSEGLRATTKELIQQLHVLFSSGTTPAAQYGPKCKSCSLIDLCMPKVTQGNRSAAGYLAAGFRDTWGEDVENCPLCQDR
jgi:CRISPR-associated exonuclease Cas4